MIIKILARLANQYSGDIKTLPNFIIAYMFAMWFMRLKERHSTVINSLAKPVFAVYIVHQVPAFISFIWKRIFMADLWIPDHAVWYVFVVYMALLAVCCMVDLVRRKTVELIIEKTAIYKWSSAVINKLYN